MEVRTRLAELRTRRGLGAAQLAEQIGVSRQTVYAIEAGTYVPNTAVSLRLARALETTVEEIFQIEPEAQTPDEILEANLLGDCEFMASGQPLRLCRVDRNLVGVAPESGGWSLPPADAVLLEPIVSGQRNAKVRVLGDKWKKPTRILLAGCDPSVSILAQTLQAEDCEVIVAYENSSRALEFLRDGMVHLAGTHLVDKATGKTDLLPVTRMFGSAPVAVFLYAIWEEGLVVAHSNPKRIGSIADLSRKDVRFTNREVGAGCRRLLDDLIRKEGLSPRQIDGYKRVAAGHLSAARSVRDGEVDCCISTAVVARALSLDFIPLARKPYHLIVRKAHLKLAPVQTLLETLSRTSFRREVEASTGYDMSNAGDRLV
jgi:putative molybdopterin biosynthesis protein